MGCTGGGLRADRADLAKPPPYPPPEYRGREKYRSGIGRNFMRLVTALLLGIFCAASAANGDEVVFKNGDTITGKIDTYDGTKLSIKTGTAKYDIELKNVRSFSTDEPIEVVLKDGT